MEQYQFLCPCQLRSRLKTMSVKAVIESFGWHLAPAPEPTNRLMMNGETVVFYGPPSQMGQWLDMRATGLYPILKNKRIRYFDNARLAAERIRNCPHQLYYSRSGRTQCMKCYGRFTDEGELIE